MDVAPLGAFAQGASDRFDDDDVVDDDEGFGLEELGIDVDDAAR